MGLRECGVSEWKHRVSEHGGMGTWGIGMGMGTGYQNGNMGYGIMGYGNGNMGYQNTGYGIKT